MRGSEDAPADRFNLTGFHKNINSFRLPGPGLTIRQQIAKFQIHEPAGQAG
jgi:hypothetical protein